MPRKPSLRPRTANSRSPSRFARSLPQRGERVRCPASRQASRILAAQVERLQALGRPLVADRLGDVGVLGGRPDHRADPRRRRGDLARSSGSPWIVSTGTMYSSPVTPLRASKWSSSASYRMHVGGLLDLRREDARRGPGTTAASRSAPVSRVASELQPDEQAHVRVSTRAARAIDGGDRLRAQRPSRSAGTESSRSKHDGVRAGLATALSTQRRLVAGDEQDGCGRACIRSAPQ